jgi:molybdopterin-guanine dinucleotide biosynthesis protein A
LNPAGRGPAQHDAESDVIGFVLAGGQSTRMGRDKALLEFAGKPLVAHALSIFEEAGIPAMIAGAASPALTSFPIFAPIVEDASPGLGPLSGICTALSIISVRRAVFLPVDLPLLPPSLLVYLLRRARFTGSAVTVSSVSGFTQTFPAVLDRAALPALQNELDSQQSVSSIAVELLAQTGEISDPLGLPPIYWFLNLNTPGDLERAEALRDTLRGRRIA